jgi:hypothetical protein
MTAYITKRQQNLDFIQFLAFILVMAGIYVAFFKLGMCGPQ